ncbi:Ficolin-2 [Holothuria leucospilota]|uniref:Ficolin-2 n=1 Tax=Holothuria leucospilota TaxID=206669 RepID=A0A9Q1CMI8_HOLLE|nr:Ficolin-2 [Holothuria leucospilota]
MTPVFEKERPTSLSLENPPLTSTQAKPLSATNTLYSNCTTCQDTCELPDGGKMNCNVPHSCVCPQRDGFPTKGEESVPQMDCRCFLQDEGVVITGELHTTPNCSKGCECRANRLVCSTLKCSENTTCDVREGVGCCYCVEGCCHYREMCLHFEDCLDLFNANFTESGIYTIKPLNWPGTPFKVYCNMTDGGGWTVFQRRLDHSVNFYRNWMSYKEGFGSRDHEHWLGNEIIFYLTNQKTYQLRIDFVAPNGNPSYAKYDLFRIANESNNYMLIGVGRYTKPSVTFSRTGYRDNLLYHIYQSFSTYDRDHDSNVKGNCAIEFHSAWWFKSCRHCDLNAANIHWGLLPGGSHNIKYTEMKLRPG